MKKPNIWYIILVLVMLIWGSFFPVSKLIVTDISPLLMAFLRYFLAIIPLFPLFLFEKKRRERVSLKDTGMMVLLGLAGITAFSIFIFYGIQLSSSTTSSILVNSQPIFATLLSPLLIQERVTRRQILGVVLGLFGMAWVVTGGDFTVFSMSNRFILGNLLGICGAASISIFYILLKQYVVRYGSIIPTFITMAGGTGFLFLALIIAKVPFSSLMTINGRQWLMILYLSIVATSFVYVLFNRAIDTVGVIKSTGFKFLIPVFAVILSILFLGERAGSSLYLGFAAVIVSILFIQVPGKK